mmetsp:Transcript_28901/g.92891  ORF Transcript_28901/g.92891 Transcript_28901/m.92891 type:complete len:239 (-) Transcript_28901:26-742(-)
MPTASRKELSEWAASLSGHSVSRELKELSTGVVLCHLVEAARPGSVEIRKLATMRSGSDTIANLKLLSVALERVDPSGELAAACDVPLLAKGQPQATLALLQKLHSYFNAENNAELAADGNSRSRSAAAEKKRTRVKPVDAAAEPAAPAGAETLTSAALAELQPALAARRAAAERRAAEMQQLRDERDFYLRKLSLIERAVSRAGNGEGEAEGAGVGALAAEVQRILRCPEEELGSVS